KLDHPVFVGSTLVPAGTYRLEISSELDGVRLLKGASAVAAAPAKVDVARAVYPGIALHTRPQADGHDKLVRIVLPDEKLSIALAPAPARAADAPAAHAPGPRCRPAASGRPPGRSLAFSRDLTDNRRTLKMSGEEDRGERSTSAAESRTASGDG